MCNFFTASDISIIVLGLCDVITDTASYRRCLCFPIFLDVQGETTNNLLAKKHEKTKKQIQGEVPQL